MSTKHWPLHPQPLPDELLSSWMVRLARANGYKIHSFYAQFFGPDRQIWNRDIDHHAPDWLIHGLSERTGVPSSRIEDMTLRSYESFAFERMNAAGSTRWILAVGVYHRTRLAYGQQFCSLCLQEDDEPYLRKHWRLALVTVCQQHSVLLQDCCAACGRPVVAHRADMSSHRSRQPRMSILHCSFCKALINAPMTSASDSAVALQGVINDILAKGYADIGSSVVYSHLYFDGLRLLMGGLSRLSDHKQRNIEFERATVSQRLRRLSAASELLTEWPAGFLGKRSALNKPYSLFSASKGLAPYWLHSVLRQDLLNKAAELSKAEAQSIALAVAHQTGSRTSSAARAFSRRDVGRFLRPKPISDEMAEMLLASIDQDISEAKGKRRLRLLRDKVLFIAGRCLHLTIPQLLALRVSQFNKPSPRKFSFWTIPNNESKATSMLHWYVKEVRLKLSPNTQAETLFISSTGLGLRDSNVGMRFSKALVRSNLATSISNWSHWSRQIR